MIHIYGKTEAGILTVESDTLLTDIEITDTAGEKIETAALCKKTQNGIFTTVLDAANLKPWSPEHPVLYDLRAKDVSQRFGFCDLRTFSNTDVLLNGERIYLRGCIRGIEAHEHPNMTGGSLKDAAVKYIRQAKKFGFNLVRFHSTIPTPEFVEAADEEGFLIHMEIGFAYEYDSAGNKTALAMDNAAWRETILKYRNHPSAAMFCIGNEMHNSGHQPGVHKLYAIGKELAPDKLILDNSGWGEYDRPTADIFAQHIAYYFPYKHHAEMFRTDDCWRINGSTYDVPLTAEAQTADCSAAIRREAVPLHPVLAHEAMHYIDVPDYDALNRKFDDFCARVGGEYLKANGIRKPRFMTELPQLIDRKGLRDKLPDYIKGSQEFKKMAYKVYLEKMRDSALCGFEMLQFADCLKYENKNGIVDCFDDDKYIDARWMRAINDDAVLLGCFEKETFFYDEAVKMTLKISDFLPSPRIRGTVTVAVNGKEIYCGKEVALAGGLQKIAEITLNFTPKARAERAEIAARFVSANLTLENSWHIWLYPHAKPAWIPRQELADRRLAEWLASSGAAVDSDRIITDRLTDAVFEHLAEGRHILLLYHRDAPGHQYYLPGALERFKPCIWDRGSNLGGVIAEPLLREALASERYFDLEMQPLLEGCYKVCLDDFPAKANEHIFGIDKPVRDRMKGLIHGIKDFIDADTLRDFSHLFTVKVGRGLLTVCTTLPPEGWRIGDPVAENVLASLCDHLDELTASESIGPEVLEKYLQRTSAAGIRKEDVMNHFWEIDNKPVEDTLYWEEVQIDLSKKKA
ncbi:MAG: hypothetical protein IJS01_03865 [Lentisphaeria bacterium]|nr:hypothetical protein [Lentisphaeria bacterium]